MIVTGSEEYAVEFDTGGMGIRCIPKLSVVRPV